MATSKRSIPPWAIVILVFVGFMFASAVCGILAAIAIPSFVQYRMRSQTVEAVQNLNVLRDAASRQCARGDGLPGSAGPLPRVPGPNRQSADFWSDPVFAELEFAPTEPLRYSYSIQPRPEGVALVAEGDLDGDGDRSRFEVACRLQDCACGEVSVAKDEFE